MASNGAEDKSSERAKEKAKEVGGGTVRQVDDDVMVRRQVLKLHCGHDNCKSSKARGREPSTKK